MPVKTRLTLAVSLCFAITAHAADRHLPGQVARVVDGDSLMIDVRGARYPVDLAFVDAPESNQPWGAEATRQLHTSLTGRFVVVDVQGPVDDRPLHGSVTLQDRDIALDLLHAGLAWSTLPADTAGSPPHPYNAAAAAARAARRGLWADQHPIPPWIWRSAPPAALPPAHD